MTFAEIESLSASIAHRAQADLNRALQGDLPARMTIQLRLRLLVRDRDSGEQTIRRVVAAALGEKST